MQFSEDEKMLAMATAYRVLVIALIQSDSLDTAAFERNAALAIGRLEATDDIGASAALAELLEPLLSDIRSFGRQRGGG